MNVVLLRGLARESSHWGDFPLRLKKSISQTINTPNIILPDIKGTGIYHKLVASRSIEESVDFVRKKIDEERQINKNQKLVLVGLSMGGMMALNWAQRYPGEVNNIVLINGSSALDFFVRRLRPEAWFRILVALCSPMPLREKVMLNTVSNREDYQEILQTWIAVQKRNPVSRRNIFIMLSAASRFSPQNHSPVPGLVIASEQDKLVNPECSKTIANLLDWPLIFHPDAGHDLPMDDPGWLAEKISSWLTDDV